jgi:DMSO reductase family type II enzyme heme b subunit
VEAEAKWQGGRWTVVLRRPLRVPSEGGVTIAAGGRYSLALAVWDGAARDRAGQKLISLWNDLSVE